jgi:predicted CopG family antitoxin
LSKTIRVTNEIFARVEVLQRVRESKSDVIARLLEIGEAWKRASDNIQADRAEVRQ